MKNKEVVLISMVAIIITVDVYWVSAQQQKHKHMKNFYENCILQNIDRCQSKVNLLKSTRSKNLQQAADVAAEKYKFLLLNKQSLIKEMHERGVGLKGYKVERYLNNRFYDAY